MDRQKGRRKTKSSSMEQIGPVLVPAAALSAVPRSPRPQTSAGTSLGSAAGPSGSRVMADPTQHGDDGGVSDPESSLYDYQLMADAGYSTVGFGTWPNQIRRSQADRDRVPTPSFVRMAASVGRLSKSGDVYQQVLDSDEEGLSQSELSAMTARSKGRGRKKGSGSLEEDVASLDRTQRDVHQAMQAVHDMSVEDTMVKMAESRQESSYPGSTSGRGTMGKGLQRSEEPGKDEAVMFLKQDMASPLSAAGGSGSGRLSSRGSRTPRDSASFTLEMEVHRLKEENHQLHEEVVNLRKVAAAIRVGDMEGAETLMLNHQLDELKEEGEVLKNTVVRLNQELSRYQAKYRPLSDEEINKRYLAPLFLAYDDLIQEKENMARQCQEELQTLKKRTEEVVRENQRYQLKGGAGSGSTARIEAAEWQELQEQARLVLEENQILMEQIAVQQNKIKELSSSHMQEVSRLTKRVTSSETEKEEMERELEETKHKYKDVKHRYDQVLLDSGSRMTVQDHINTVADLKKSVTEEKEQYEKEKEKLASRLKASDEERKQQTLAAIEVETENKQLRAEIRALHKAVRRSQNKMLIMQKAIQQSENKELVTQSELANVIRIVEKTALERDTAFKVVKEQQRDCKDTVNQMVGNSVVMGKMEEKLKLYKQKASVKLQNVSDKLKEQDDCFNQQRQEYEREIRYLRMLVKEKEALIAEMEGDKKGVEEDLESMWKAASSENMRLKDTLRNSVYQLRQHSSLKHMLDEEEELEKLVHFSE